MLIGLSPKYVNDDAYTGGFTRQNIDDLLEFQDSNFLGWSSTVAPTIMGSPDRPELGEELVNSFLSNGSRDRQVVCRGHISLG